MYCEIYEEIDLSAYPITIPSGYHFISMNIGVDYVPLGPPKEAQTSIFITYYYGIPNCIPELEDKPYADALYMNLPDAP